jgi:hypothetical protein
MLASLGQVCDVVEEKEEGEKAGRLLKVGAGCAL